MGLCCFTLCKDRGADEKVTSSRLISTGLIVSLKEINDSHSCEKKNQKPKNKTGFLYGTQVLAILHILDYWSHCTE